MCSASGSEAENLIEPVDTTVDPTRQHCAPFSDPKDPKPQNTTIEQLLGGTATKHNAAITSCEPGSGGRHTGEESVKKSGRVHHDKESTLEAVKKIGPVEEPAV